MLYRRRLDMDMEELKPDLSILRAACGELRTSKRFQILLQTVLAIGNSLNNGSFRGGAAGFSLDSLLKVRSVLSLGLERRMLTHRLLARSCKTFALRPARRLRRRSCTTSSASCADRTRRSSPSWTTSRMSRPHQGVRPPLHLHCSLSCN